MFIIGSYTWAVTMCLVTLLLGSWANTPKLPGMEWRFRLFYWDYAIRVILLSLLPALRLDSPRTGGRGFLTDLWQVEERGVTFYLIGLSALSPSNLLFISGNFLILRPADYSTLCPNPEL